MIRGLGRSPVVVLIGALSGAASASAGDGLFGFAPASATRQRAVEAAFAAIPSPERTREWHRTFTAEPHPAGSERNHELGKIVLLRYSNPYSYRGFKALTAERQGAAGILIYSDPAEDGFKRGPVFPDGPWGPASHIQ